jgi:hypothetical protein
VLGDIVAIVGSPDMCLVRSIAERNFPLHINRALQRGFLFFPNRPTPTPDDETYWHVLEP